MIHPDLERIRRRWLVRSLLGAALFGVGLGAPLGAWMTPDRPRLALFVVGSAALGMLAAWLRRDDVAAVARHLDRRVPALEDSCELLVQAPEDLSPVARLQRERVAEVLSNLSPRGLLPFGSAARGLIVAGVGVALGIAILMARFRVVEAAEGTAATAPPVAGVGRGVVVEAVRHRVQPPRYTGRKSFEGDGLTARFPAESDVAWRVDVAGPVTDAFLETPAGRARLRRSEKGRWVAQRRVHQSAAYRLILERDGEQVYASPWSRLEAVADRPPAVRVTDPDGLVERAAGDLAPLPLEVELEDDYGLGPAELVLTLASGAGEMVEFREERRALGTGTGSAVSRRIRTTLDLRALGLEDGGELYFRVEAPDNREPEAQRGRSATRIVRVRGGAGPSVDLGAGLPIVAPPDVFRSQRQIILDTEALIADRPRLAREELVRRSEAIGFDQRALRMRYGTLLGDEFESGAAVEAEPHDDGHGPGAHEGGGGGGAPTGLPEGLVHMHDSAEMATFFPDAIRSALREALAAMWDAEKGLRSVDPDGALPHERRALERLQEVRRQSRVYVQRVGFDPPPLDPETARLSGELDEIGRPRRRVPDARSAEPAARLAYRQLAEGVSDREALLAALREAGSELAERAVDLPGVGLEGVGALAEVRDALAAGESPSEDALGLSLRSLWSLMSVPSERPVRRVDASTAPEARSGGGT